MFALLLPHGKTVAASDCRCERLTALGEFSFRKNDLAPARREIWETPNRGRMNIREW